MLLPGPDSALGMLVCLGAGTEPLPVAKHKRAIRACCSAPAPYHHLLVSRFIPHLKAIIEPACPARSLGALHLGKTALTRSLRNQLTRPHHHSLPLLQLVSTATPAALLLLLLLLLGFVSATAEELGCVLIDLMWIRSMEI